VPIGHGNSFFWSWKSHGKSLLKKSGHPVNGTASRFLGRIIDSFLQCCDRNGMKPVKQLVSKGDSIILRQLANAGLPVHCTTALDRDGGRIIERFCV